MMAQTGIFDWLVENLGLAILLLGVSLIILMAIYFKLYVRIIYEGTTYRHYRKGRLVKETNKGGMVILIPFFDKLEIEESDLESSQPE
ncbi:MAG: hypothetical protein ACFFD6_10270 [Candidatus Thorarchaeota archaeon]